MLNNLKIIKEEVTKILDSDNTGHGMDHINRVVNIASDIAKKESANLDLVTAISLLHDVDDYKLFGEKNSVHLSNVNMILDKTLYSSEEKKVIKDAIKTIGYSKRLEGITPNILEAKIVSDADMLDALGAIGILRTYHYSIKKDRVFFDKEKFPVLDMDAKEYRQKTEGTGINHLFEKILKLKDLMLTEAGKIEAQKRHQFVVEFLKEYFYEEKAESWLEFLNQYINV